MRPEDLEVLSGSRGGDRVVADCWYDGELIQAALPISSWQVAWDRHRQVQAQGTIVVADADGTLSPWAVDDPLNVAGPVIHLTYMLPPDGEVSLGWYRLTRASVSQSWRSQRILRTTGSDGIAEETHIPPRWTSYGEVTASVDDLTWGVHTANFLGPEPVEHPDSVLAEVERLCDGIVSVEVAEGIQDSSVPETITYSKDRLGAVVELLDFIDAEPRMNSDGVLQVVPSDPGPVVWEIAGGEDGVLVDFARTFNAADFINTVVAEGKSSSDTPLIGVSRQTSGPLAATGPHGMVPQFRSSDLLDTQEKVDQAASRWRRQLATERSISLPVTCLPHPGLQVGDVVRLSTPVGDLTGPVESVRMSGSANGVAPMEIELAVPSEDMQIIGRALRDVT